jgi:SAM-dependent methyltransferase
MQINAQAHLLRAARESGIIDALRSGQLTKDQLVEKLKLDARMAGLLLDAMVAMQVLEKYGDDYAVAAVTRLLCQYDADLGDAVWADLADQVRGGKTGVKDKFYDATTATQWVHTAAAKQAAEILDIAGERTGRKILDLGCGSAVWSAAMAYADEATTVTAVDTPERLIAAKRTIDSIGLGPRYEFIEADPETYELSNDTYGLVLIAGRITGQSPEYDMATIERSKKSLIHGGELVVIDLFKGPGRPGVNESIEAIRLATQTPEGQIRDAEAMRALMVESGFGACQFAFIAASRQGWGLLLAAKSS